MALTDAKIRNAGPKEKPHRLSDGQGLFLFVTPQGGKWWRFRYHFDGKEKMLSFGTYPEVTLEQARAKRLEARRQVAGGEDPGVIRKAEKRMKADRAGNTFEVVAREWYEKFANGYAATTQRLILGRLEREVFPRIGDRPIDELSALDVLHILQDLERRGTLETAHRVRNICSQVFRFAVATGRAERDPTGDLRGAIPPQKVRHMSAITEPAKVAELLRAIDGYDGSFTVKCALQLMPLTFVRPGELRHAEWSEFDLEAQEWNIPAGRMKMKQPHTVPLSTQAVDILKALHPLTGSGRYLFPSVRSTARPFSDNTINAALRRMGFTTDEMTGHGFRAMARTILDEVLQFRPDFIEHQLAHSVKDPLGRAYNRTAHLAERRKMMQTWADYLDGLKSGAKVIPFRGRSGQ